MDDINQKPIEWQFVTRLAQCIRLYNAINSTTVPLPNAIKAAFEKDIKKYGDERRRIESEIAAAYGLNPQGIQRVIKEICNEMSEADGGYITCQGSPMWRRIDEFVAKFAAGIKAIKAAD